VAYVEQGEDDDISIEDEESNASNGTPPTNRPSHARKKKEEGKGMSSFIEFTYYVQIS
jgi:hypothetical protein